MIFSNRDTNRMILDKLDDKSVINLCSINNVCDDKYFKNRIIEKYPDLIDQKEEYESWKQFFIRIVNRLPLSNLNTQKASNIKMDIDSTSKYYERHGNIEYVAKKNLDELNVFMILNGIKIGDMKMKYSQYIESYDELHLLKNANVGDEIWGNQIEHELNVDLALPNLLISWIGIRIDKERKGYGKSLLAKGIYFGILAFPNVKWIYLYRSPKYSAKLLKFYSQAGFIDTGFKGIMYLRKENIIFA